MSGFVPKRRKVSSNTRHTMLLENPFSRRPRKLPSKNTFDVTKTNDIQELTETVSGSPKEYFSKEQVLSIISQTEKINKPHFSNPCPYIN